MLKPGLANRSAHPLILGIFLGAFAAALVGFALFRGPQLPTAVAADHAAEEPNCVAPVAMGQTQEDNMAHNYFALLKKVELWRHKGYPNSNDRLTRQATADLVAPFHCGYVAAMQYLGRDDGAGKRYWSFIMVDMSTIEVIRNHHIGDYRLRLAGRELRVSYDLGKAIGFPE